MNSFDTVTFVYAITDRNTLKTEPAHIDTFLEELCTKLKNLKPHAFYAKEQNLFLEHLRELFSISDFQRFSKINSCTRTMKRNQVHQIPWQIKKKKIKTWVSSVSLLSKRRILTREIFPLHETQEVILKSVILSQNRPKLLFKALKLINWRTGKREIFQKHINKYLRKKFSVFNKIYYVPGRAAQNFKNKYVFSNLFNRKKYFGIPAITHFQAATNDRGSGEAIRENLKRLAPKASF